MELKKDNITSFYNSGQQVFSFTPDRGYFAPIYMDKYIYLPIYEIASFMHFMSGSADTDWLLRYHPLFKKVSTDKYDSFSFGERVRFWNRQEKSNFVFNPQDQLIHVFEQIINSNGKCHPVIQIYNPIFDNDDQHETHSDYPLTITFDWENNNVPQWLNMNVHFSHVDSKRLITEYLFTLSAIHHLLVSWLCHDHKCSHAMVGKLTIYIDDYHASIKRKALLKPVYLSEPEMNYSIDNSLSLVDMYFQSLDHLFESPSLTSQTYKATIKSTNNIHDEFFHDTILVLCASSLMDFYAQSLDKKDLDKVFETIHAIYSDWKILLLATIKMDKRFIIPEHISQEFEKIGQNKELDLIVHNLNKDTM